MDNQNSQLKYAEQQNEFQTIIKKYLKSDIKKNQNINTETESLYEIFINAAEISGYMNYLFNREIKKQKKYNLLSKADKKTKENQKEIITTWAEIKKLYEKIFPDKKIPNELNTKIFNSVKNYTLYSRYYGVYTFCLVICSSIASKFSKNNKIYDLIFEYAKDMFALRIWDYLHIHKAFQKLADNIANVLDIETFSIYQVYIASAFIYCRQVANHDDINTTQKLRMLYYIQNIIDANNASWDAYTEVRVCSCWMRYLDKNMSVKVCAKQAKRYINDHLRKLKKILESDIYREELNEILEQISDSEKMLQTLADISNFINDSSFQMPSLAERQEIINKKQLDSIIEENITEDIVNFLTTRKTQKFINRTIYVLTKLCEDKDLLRKPYELFKNASHYVTALVKKPTIKNSILLHNCIIEINEYIGIFNFLNPEISKIFKKMLNYMVNIKCCPNTSYNYTIRKLLQDKRAEDSFNKEYQRNLDFYCKVPAKSVLFLKQLIFEYNIDRKEQKNLLNELEDIYNKQQELFSKEYELQTRKKIDVKNDKLFHLFMPSLPLSMNKQEECQLNYILDYVAERAENFRA